VTPVTAYLLSLGSFNGAPPRFVLTSLVTITVFALPIAYLAAVVLGIPAYTVARRRGLLGLGHSLAIGAAMALLPGDRSDEAAASHPRGGTMAPQD
jgi:hypothetical protein